MFSSFLQDSCSFSFLPLGFFFFTAAKASSFLTGFFTNWCVVFLLEIMRRDGSLPPEAHSFLFFSWWSSLGCCGELRARPPSFAIVQPPSSPLWETISSFFSFPLSRYSRHLDFFLSPFLQSEHDRPVKGENFPTFPRHSATVVPFFHSRPPHPPIDIPLWIVKV